MDLPFIISESVRSPCFSFMGIFGLLIGFITITFLYTGDIRFHNLKKVIPGPPQLPLIGNVLQFLVPEHQLIPLILKWMKEYGPRILIRIGTVWIVTIASAKDMEKLLGSTTETTKNPQYELLMPWLGQGLVTSKGKKWSQRRKMLTPAFHFKILEKSVEVFDEQSRILVDILKADFSDGEYLDISPFLSRYTLDVICEAAMGIKMNAQKDRETEYILAISRIKKLQQLRAFRPWRESSILWNLSSFGREYKKLVKTVHDFTDNVIRERKSEFAKTSKSTNIHAPDSDENSIGMGKRRVAFLDLMLEAQENGEDLNDEGIREETDTFMFAGHDTVSISASFTIFLIGNHPEIQEKVEAELEDVFVGDANRAVKSEDVKRLKYLECCIKESLRLCPPIHHFGRSIQDQFQLDEGVILPPGTMAIVIPYQLHRDPQVFPDPEEYRPERFTPENSQGRHPYAFLPFSAGSRNCIGQKFAMMEQKILLANVFRNLRVESLEKLEDLEFVPNMLLEPKSGIKMKITPK